MTAPLPPAAAQQFADVPHTPAEHFRMALFGVIAQLVQRADDDLPALMEAHPFLADYHRELASRAGSDPTAPSRWRAALQVWEEGGARTLPINALRAAGMPRLAIDLLFAVGLVEEDPRFGEVFAALQGHEARPTFGLLLAWWRTTAGDDAELVRATLLELVQSGLLTVLNPGAPRSQWELMVPHAVWDALRGHRPALRWLTHSPHDTLLPLEAYIVPAAATRCAALPGLLQRSGEYVVVVRGPRHNGRKTLLGSVARALGKSLLVADETTPTDESRWGLLGLFSILLDALPVLDAPLSSGETRVLPALPLVRGPLAVVTGRQGAWVSGEGRPLLTIDLPLPDLEQRVRHWESASSDQPVATLRSLAATGRLTSGHIRQAAKMAGALAALERRATIQPADLQEACRGLRAARLETLATRLPTAGTLDEIVLPPATRGELDALLARCRYRETLAATTAAVAQGNIGVRALFSGPSGTGKTLAARLMAGTLGKDLYRLDLAATVNKYLGETEKNLDQAFAAAEELDAILLLDEGDALLTNRTDVGTANDRYANLETNFLLQRLESFEGVLLVTSNAADRIDKAFARRMDAVVHFRAPDERQRYDVVRLHLAEGDDVDDAWLQEAAYRCALTGGQWRSVVAHARLLALRDSRPLDSACLHEALTREYQKTGAQCPLRWPAARQRSPSSLPAQA